MAWLELKFETSAVKVVGECTKTSLHNLDESASNFDVGVYEGFHYSSEKKVCRRSTSNRLDWDREHVGSYAEAQYRPVAVKGKQPQPSSESIHERNLLRRRQSQSVLGVGAEG